MADPSVREIHSRSHRRLSNHATRSPQPENLVVEGRSGFALDARW
jgi:hypothetical protein